MEDIKKQHKKETKRLHDLKLKLIKLIVNTGNEILKDKFLDWQNQRNKCNIVYLDYLKVMILNDE